MTRLDSRGVIPAVCVSCILAVRAVRAIRAVRGVRAARAFRAVRAVKAVRALRALDDFLRGRQPADVARVASGKCIGRLRLYHSKGERECH